MKKLLKEKYGISEEIMTLSEEVLAQIKPQTDEIRKVAKYNQIKVLAAFNDHKISDAHLLGSTGYGYNDRGREAIDAVYAQVFGAEDALVRHNIICGTHAIALCLYAVLRPGDTLVSVTGKPYDTLEEVIGTGSFGLGSLKDFGVHYKQVDLANGEVDYNNIMSTIDENTKAVLIQKSKGYDWRPSLTNQQIGEIIRFVQGINRDIICIVDNCYGEFAEPDEPTDHGADLIAGSLIKNPGGGIAQTGGYVTGRAELVELAAYRLNCVGLGKHVGATSDANRQILHGLFMAPHIVAESMMAALFCGSVFERLGFEVCPKPGDYRSDIIQAIKLGSEEKVVRFCEGIQRGAPIDSFVTPVPWDMPGYKHQVIMAAGAFTQGASIELSADAPIKPPYIAYMQGGLTFDSAYVGILCAAQNVVRCG